MNRLSLDVYYLIVEALDTRQDLKNVCLVSKAFHSLATPVLYRSIILKGSDKFRRTDWDISAEDGKSEEHTRSACHGLIDRLLDERNGRIRVAVRDLTIEWFQGAEDSERIMHKLEQPDNILIRFVKQLPNLENMFFYDTRIPLTKSILDTLWNHTNKPKLHLMSECGTTQTDIKMPCVHTLCTRIDGFSTSTGVDQQRLALREVFSACPNLYSLSISISFFWSGCVMPSILPSTEIVPLHLTESETIPPLRELTLSGYNIRENEWVHWRDRFPWSNLESLTLGPEESHDNLKLMAGHVHTLKSFAISAFDNHRLDKCDELENFVASFNSLESLTVKGYFLPVTAVASHPNLRHFCLHTIETPERERPTPKKGDIEYLDEHCQKLASLELDISREKHWPNDIVNTIATRFTHLRELSFHVGLGIRRMFGSQNDTFESRRNNLKPHPKLDHSASKDFARGFFASRGPSSKLQKLSLYTGESLRRFPQWQPEYADFEDEHRRSCQIRPPQVPGEDFDIFVKDESFSYDDL
ncbi:hypothetical protein ETB97_005672 [Aspergillus alliaceus]|uniref:F-box domain-containing protein n=1 Tax=Petromyces alliaceus TaxID=209559 RepID=A0A8H6A177_PETAA|nr:hypothetical protein ETB97_005672 [Aspergillus burnettii]